MKRSADIFIAARDEIQRQRADSIESALHRSNVPP